MREKTLSHSKRVRNVQIEGLRGFSIMVIVVYHIFCRYKQLYLNDEIWWMRDWGTFGVEVFFLISTFFLVDFSKPERHSDFRFVSWIAKKLLRLWPCYAVSITITFILLRFYPLPGRTTNLQDYFLNLCFLNGFIGTPYVDRAHWYLTNLLSMYLIIGFGKKLCVSTKYWFYYLLIIVVEGTNILHLQTAFKLLGGGNTGYLCVGVGLRALFQCIDEGQWKKNTKQMIAWIGVVAGGMTLVFLCAGHVDAYLLLLSVPLFCLCVRGRLGLFGRQPLLYIGRISYPLYLIHQNIAFLIIYVCTSAVGSYHWLYGCAALLVIGILGNFLYLLDQRMQKSVSCIFKGNEQA